MSTPTNEHEAIWTPDGHKRILNLQPSDPAKRARYRGVPFDVIPLDQIEPFDDWPAQVLIKDQDGAGACQGHASATNCEFARAMAGMPHVPLSAWWVYGVLVQGRDRGSNILDGLELIQTKGVAPEGDVKYGDYSGKYSAQAQADALRYRLEIGEELTTWEEMSTAAALRRVMNASVRATNGWSGRLDSNGCPPVGRGPGNHAITIGGGIKRLPESRRAIRGILRGLTVELALRMANSWGTQWGDRGFCWLTRDHWESGTWRECFTAVAVVHDPEDTVPVAA